ncbi:UV DNA damage endonuclease [Sedimentibacter acidaminivorans]|uniref:UV DNA damage endonuclease n=1 Tax=Sedimentibacter acidaminivorans TaxID=913099 RepID=A0ABS4GBA6_9FIRM|nr:UV DNA damage repair endonuclease UvsE [Sedimentibacter acidaminivorans]MBP1924968.1 UV DNA damage endonuclease [Sedimentibacter acidaminivorans]
MSIGYACLTIGVNNTNYKSCIMKNASKERLLEIISHNLNSLENIIDYNIKNKIMLFRISSDLIPFGSSPVNDINWWDVFSSKFKSIGKKIKESNMRVSMHPGQYTVLNSPNEDIVAKAIEDLNYHNKVLDSLDLEEDHKIVLHIGGVYNNKKEAIKRFIQNYDKLYDNIKKRLVIENDDKSYNICDVLAISKVLDIPVIYDNLHNNINPSFEKKSDFYWIEQCNKTWKSKDGHQKIHYSQQKPFKKAGSHSNTIKINEFIDFYNNLNNKSIDIMLEVKDKNLSAVKCINCTESDKNIKKLELEWAKYKYNVLEHSSQNYLEIRKILKQKTDYPVLEFYNLIEDSFIIEVSVGNTINAAQHIWGYFKNCTTEKEKNDFFKKIDNYENERISIANIKKYLFKLAIKYDQKYLLNSYYFIL